MTHSAFEEQQRFVVGDLVRPNDERIPGEVYHVEWNALAKRWIYGVSRGRYDRDYFADELGLVQSVEL